MTSKPPPSSMAATMFLPMSCRSPLTVPMTTRPAGSAPLGGQQRPQQFERALHGARGEQQFGDEVFLALEAPSDLVHGRHHVRVSSSRASAPASSACASPRAAVLCRHSGSRRTAAQIRHVGHPVEFVHGIEHGHDVRHGRLGLHVVNAS